MSTGFGRVFRVLWYAGSVVGLVLSGLCMKRKEKMRAFLLDSSHLETSFRLASPGLLCSLGPGSCIRVVLSNALERYMNVPVSLPHCVCLP